MRIKLADLKANQANLSETLLHISAAIQVLEELVKNEEADSVETLVHTNGVSTEEFDLMEELEAA